MRSLSRPFLSILVVLLLTTWGTCPCVFAKMLRSVQAASETEASAAACCCCKPVADAPTDPAKAPEPGSDDCPCCESGGWMRDLPPQVQALALEAPGVSPFDAALARLACPTHAAFEADMPDDTVMASQRPPGDPRPHAAPVGIVRLLL